MRRNGVVCPLAAVLLGGWVRAVAGDTVRLHEDLPKAGTFTVLRMVYPVGGEVKLSDFTVDAGDKQTIVYAGLLPWSQLHNLVDSQFCGPDGRLQFAAHLSEKDVVSIKANPGSVASGEGQLQRMPYGIFVARCGGEATAKASFVLTWEGSASGHEQYVFPICGLSALALTAVLLWWLFAMHEQAEHCQSIHQSILLLGGVALIEASCHVAHYVMLSAAGEDRAFESLGSAMFTTKVGLCFNVLFEAADLGTGGGVTTKHFLFILVGTLGVLPRTMLGLIRHTELAPMTLTLQYTALAALSGLLAAAFAGKQLIEGIRRAKESEQQDLVGNLRQTCVAMLFLLAAAAFVAVLDVFDHPEVDGASWGYHAMAVTAPSQAAFFVVLVHMMFVWQPRPELMSTKLPAEAAETDGLTAARSDDDGDEERGGPVVAETIGATGPVE